MIHVIPLILFFSISILNAYNRGWVHPETGWEVISGSHMSIITLNDVYINNEIAEDNSPALINSKQYTSPTTRILSGLYFKAINTENANSDAIYGLVAMDFIISNSLILSNQLILDLSDSDDISPSSLSSKLICNINSTIAIAPSYTYKKYSNESYESFIMLESSVQFLNFNYGNFNSNIKVSPYVIMSLGGKNTVYAKNEFGISLKLFFD